MHSAEFIIMVGEAVCKMQTKICSKCKKIKSIEDFNKDRTKKDGLRSSCKKCTQILNRQYHINNIEVRNKKSREYYKKNEEKLKEYQKEYRKNNPEKTREYQKEFRLNNPKKVKEYSKEYRKNNIEKMKKYRRNNAEKIRERSKNYYKNNLEKVKERRKRFIENNPDYEKERSKQYRINNPEKMKEHYKKVDKKRMSNPTFKLSRRISHSIWQSLRNKKNGKSGKHWEIVVDFTLSDLIKHLENQFREGMTWNNYGIWHIDHIRPVSSFSFNSYEDKEFKQCWALSNLQPLWAEDNLRKSNKMNFSGV
jgi:hypothetical protein